MGAVTGDLQNLFHEVHLLGGKYHVLSAHPCSHAFLNFESLSLDLTIEIHMRWKGWWEGLNIKWI
jgi:hypothetical protein